MGLARAVANVIKVPDAVDEMAPALTEPLSQSKLSSSATSGASPRTGIETTSQQEVPSSASTDSGTGTASTNPSETDLVLTDSTLSSGIGQTVDDIQNNNDSGGQLLKIDSDSGKDLIELALEQLHRDETAGTVAESAIAGGSIQNEVEISQAVIDQIVQVASTSEETATASEVQSDLQQLDSQSSIISSSSTAMGLQKDYLKDNPDMEQMLGELASTSDMELLQVFKSLEGNPSGDGLCAELAGGLSLFNDVDVNIYEEVAQATPPNKDHERLEMHAEIVKRQSQMQRKYDFLIRRLNKLQARYMGQHVSEEIAGLFEYSQRYWKKKDKEHAKGHAAGVSTVSPTSLIPDIIPYQPPPPSSDKLKPISANAMKTFAKRLEGIATTQCSTQTRRIYSNRYFQGTASGSTIEGGSGTSSSSQTTSIPKFDDTVIDQLELTAGLLHSELHQVQNTIDSEATVSSSGGESADEMVMYNNVNQQPLTIAKRAAWRWAKDRASVAARWTWLLAQISDLEYRIRQHNELHNKIKINKGAVTLEDSHSQPPQPPSHQSVNGYRGTLPGNNKPLDDSYDNNGSSSSTAPNGAYDHSGGSCRTRPFHRNGFRKRKLLQTANLHTISKKAARSSSVKCGCAWPLHPCALCTGRQDPTAPRDLPDTMPASERVALLDPCFHPVLSFPEDVSHGIHFEAIMRIPEWQNKMIRSTAKSLSRSAGAPQKSTGFGSTSAASGGALPSSVTPAFLSSGDEAVPHGGNKKYGPDGKRKYNKHNKLHGSQELANHKLKKSKSRRNLLLTSTTGRGRRKSSSGYPPGGSSQYGPTGYGATPGGSSNKYYKSSSSKYRKSSHSSSTAASGTGTHGAGTGSYTRYNSGGIGGASSGFDYMDSAGLHHDGAGSGSSRSKNSSPTPNHHRNERKSRPSYDIDNIVIPYSMAAANKVELLPYKEIVTPKWRIVGDNDESIDPDSETIDASQLIKTASGNNNSAPDAGNKQSVSPKPAIIPPTEKVSDLTQSLSEGRFIVLPAIDEEDISDETILVKHDRALQDERKKFRTYMKFPWSRPRANRRTDSRAESSGANTPDPTSPAPPTPLVDIESNTSPACPSTPLMSLDTHELSETNVLNALNQSLNKKERRRTVSTKLVREEIQRSSSPDIKEVIPPYDSLQFPLPDDLYEEMVRTMPSDHLTLVEDAINKLTRPNRPNNNVLLANRNNLNLAPSSSGHVNNPLSSNLSTTSTTISAIENDLDDLECNDNDDELMQAKKVENQIIMEKLLKSCDENRMFVGVRQVLDDDDPMDDEETDTGESLFVEEDDPNDPEWYDRPGRGRT
ncbi:uncharacterized protein LOC131683961 [Topomyia yanbarensis]|uniref:uncharacterized protein LOC131683961 n=1 Tax=Topomyia yanbarensis TaxID=2498891 RepID=UPI00273CE04E|nr:uncharacterized protein LOC131683961 [Topomyia yanbarensis]XP_058822367.1 uncharacterized protein LOC131683961 [Topomyia yanbarensis]XP_058822368.1 uncharacterized protein LOC131683961 [Topomyia yanbarensis]XP_058822369.1 uncharacterized protein LOC131683961 [Topomyia yanbarensis]